MKHGTFERMHFCIGECRQRTKGGESEEEREREHVIRYDCLAA